MTIFTDFATKVETFAENGLQETETAIVRLETSFKPLLTKFEPEQFSILIKAVEDSLPLFLTGQEGAGFTALLGDLGVQEISWWHTAEPEVQTAVLNVLVANAKLGAAVSAVPSADAPAEAATPEVPSV